MSNPTELRTLERLEREGRMAGSQVPRSLRTAGRIPQLLRVNVLEEQRSGSGRVLTVVDPEGLSEMLNTWYPGRFQAAQQTAIDNVARYRSTKAGSKQAFRVVLLRGKGTVSLNEHTFDLGQATDRFGCAACLQPRLRAERICVVENLDTFHEAEGLLGDRTYVHPYGRIGGKTFGALETEDLLHFGDYDFTGLADYLRLRKSFPQARLHLPPDLESLWGKLSSPLKAKAVVPRRVRESKLPEVKRVLDLLHRSGRFLEQQALFVAKAKGV